MAQEWGVRMTYDKTVVSRHAEHLIQGRALFAEEHSIPHQSRMRTID